MRESEWRRRAAEHAARADDLTAGWRERRSRHETHPVDDFLFTYYPYKPAVLRRWHPGAGVVLEGAAGERGEWSWYARTGGDSSDADLGADAVVDAAAFVERHASAVRFIRSLLSRTSARAGQFGCFGLHEWAMVYRDGSDDRDHRHPVPLRLGQAETDAVVESHRIQCTHFDAFRFFTPDARPLNRLQPTRESQPDLDQPGCLHAGMDVYKWAIKLGPLVPGELLLDCFVHARAIRDLDMAASPYDMTPWGLEPVRIEDPEGKAEYVRRQRVFAEAGDALRVRLVAAVDVAWAEVEQPDTEAPALASAGAASMLA